MLPPTPQILLILMNARAQLLAREDAQLQRMASSWLEIENSVRGQMYQLASEIAALQAEGRLVDEQLLRELASYKNLDDQLRQHILSYTTDVAVPDIEAEQLVYGLIGAGSAYDAIKAGFIDFAPMFRKVDQQAIETYVGLLGNGSPLYTLLQEAYPDSVDAIVKSLLEGFALGLNPITIAENMTKALGVGLDRMTLIARTEQLRVWRLSMIQQYRDSGVVLGFKRLVVKDFNTCMACLMADGEVYELADELEDHPRGRCTAVPILPGIDITWQTGQEWFDGLDAQTQIDMMGQAKWDAWQAGQFQLTDLYKVAHSDVWGDSPRVATLKELLGGAS
jgi:hypothetical protein